MFTLGTRYRILPFSIYFSLHLQVDKPGGMEVINQAIEIAESRCPEADWALVNVGVAPSTITITFSDPKRSPIDCRVRFLSFLGIGKDPRKCAFVGMYLFFVLFF